MVHAKTVTPPSLANIPVFRAATMVTARGDGPWRFENLVGVLAEIAEEIPCGAVSFAVEIIAEAQEANEPAAWVSAAGSIFFPPDLASRGIDLSAIAVVRAGGETESLTAAEWLAGSGAMGLVVVDLEDTMTTSDASLGRLQKLAERNHCAVVFLTRKRRQDVSLGSRISVHGFVSRSGTPRTNGAEDSGLLFIEICTLKDKRSNPGARMRRQYNGPPGMY
jgi:hypothetical protein